MVKFFICRAEEFNTKAMLIKSEIIDFLNISSVESLKLCWGYQVEGLSKRQIEDSAGLILNTKTDQLVFNLEENAGNNFSFTSLETGYDQKAEAMENLLQIKHHNKNIKIATFKHIVLNDKVSAIEMSNIKKYLINPLEDKEINLNDNIIPFFENEIDDAVIIDGFISANAEQLLEIKNNYEISMNMGDLIFCRDYFLSENRNPTITEVKILDTYWSDHCRHSTFLTVFDHIDIEKTNNHKSLLQAVEHYESARKEVYSGSDRPDCLMDIATIQMKKMKKLGQLGDLEESEEINACSFEAAGMVDGKEEDFVIMFKNETHNHPTEVEPYGGAGTCIGGGIRDPLSGRSFVFGGLRITGSADPREPYSNTLAGKIPQRKITKTAANGFSDYANQIGLASGYLNEYYHPGFKAKRMECGALVAYNYKKNITRASSEKGDVIILIGGKTGRDGIGGATGSSKQQAGKAEKYSSEVQKGNPIIERNIIRMFKKPEVSKIIKKCNDFGAGGVSVAIGELADSLIIDLDKVPTKYNGLNGTEIAISESQERMAVVVSPEHKDFILQQAKEENLLATAVAIVTDDKRIVINFNGKEICNMSSDFLNSGGVRQHTDIKVALKPLKQKENTNILADLKHSLSDINVASKQSLAHQFDKTVGGQTVFMPYGGKLQKTPEQGLAMRLPLEKGTTNLGTVMTVGYNPELSSENTFIAAIYAVVESVMKSISMGGKLNKTRLSFQEYFESMKNTESWGKAYSALIGSYLVQHKLNIPAIGGKDSMSGTYGEINVPPSLISFAVTPVDCSKLVSKAFKNSDSNIYLLKTVINADGTPDFTSLKDNINFLEGLIEKGKVEASTVVGCGGIATEIALMSFGNNIGFTLLSDKETLANSTVCDVLIETKEKPASSNLILLGNTTTQTDLIFGDEKITIAEALTLWESPLLGVFGDSIPNNHPQVDLKPTTKAIKSVVKTSKPKVLIPIFMGTTGEYSLAKQFVKVGAYVKTILIKTMDFEASAKEFIAELKTANIIAIPSGTSLGGQPESTAKIITHLLNLADVKQAVNNFIAAGGSVIGFGEGFKALVETGLIENESISSPKTRLTITQNSTGRYFSDLVEVEYLSNNDLTRGMKTTLVPVSIYEGRVVLNIEDFAEFNKKGQILSVYTTKNPVGSYYDIEGMISENGKIIGFVSDLSVVEEGLYSNVYKAETPSIFKNIVNLYKEN